MQFVCQCAQEQPQVEGPAVQTVFNISRMIPRPMAELQSLLRKTVRFDMTGLDGELMQRWRSGDGTTPRSAPQISRSTSQFGCLMLVHTARY